MYYNRILRVWVIDLYDYFLLGAIMGSLLAPRLKDYLSEKKAMERLKNSIIKKSELVRQLDRSNSNYKKIKLKKIYQFALGNRGGQFEEFQVDHQVSNEVFKLAQQIKGLVERLARFLKERELKGLARIFFKNGRLILELILYKCRINIAYSLLNEEFSTQVIVITYTVGGAAGFTLTWFSAAVTLVAPPTLILTLLIRNALQQIGNQKDYSKFKMLFNKMLEDEELTQTIKSVFVEGKVPTTPTSIEMKPWDSDKNSLPEFNFDSDRTSEEFIKAKMKEQLGLVEDPTPEQLKQIINKPKAKTTYYKDFINQIAEDPDDIIDAEIIKEAIKVKVKNEEL